MQCSLVSRPTARRQNFTITVAEGLDHGMKRPRRVVRNGLAAARWASGHIGATPEPSATNATNARVAPARPEKDPEMTGGPGIRGLRWWAILGLNQ